MMFLSRGKVKILSSGLLVMNIFLVSLLFRDKKKNWIFSGCRVWETLNCFLDKTISESRQYSKAQSAMKIIELHSSRVIRNDPWYQRNDFMQLNFVKEKCQTDKLLFFRPYVHQSWRTPLRCDIIYIFFLKAQKTRWIIGAVWRNEQERCFTRCITGDGEGGKKKSENKWRDVEMQKWWKRGNESEM